MSETRHFCMSDTLLLYSLIYRHCEKIMYYENQQKTASEVKNHPDMNLALKSNS